MAPKLGDKAVKKAVGSRGGTPAGTPRDKAGDKKMSNPLGGAPPKAGGGKKDATAAASKEKAPNVAPPSHLGEKPSYDSRAMEKAIVTAEMSAIVHAAASAAKEAAIAAGLTKEQAQGVHDATTRAAIAVIDPNLDQSDLLDGAESEVPTAEKIENALARAVKQNAVRTMDIFRDWDANNDGMISKAEFRKALRSLGVEGGKGDHDALFDMWDADGSGAIDYKELDKALRKAGGKLTALVGAPGVAEEDHFSAINAAALKGGVKAANVKQAKEVSEANKAVAMERALSPRSQQLKEMAEQEAAQKALEEAARIAAEDEDTTTWTVPKFLASKGLSKVVAAALQLPPRKSGDASHFVYTKDLSKEKLQEVLAPAKLEGLVDFIYSCVESLTAQKTGSASKLNDKFASSGKFQMTYGSLSLFYGGLESLLGPPKMYKGPNHTEKSLFNTMETEHLNGPDAKEEFTSNMGCKTTSETEWVFVTNPAQKDIQYPERDGYRESHPTWVRVPLKLDQMMVTMEEKCNERLRKDGHSEMIKEELVAGRLYTGPLYAKYNTVLRAKSKDPYMVKLATNLTKGNGYPTTIHAVNSCVIKLSKLTKAGKVWRGIKDATLPKEFWVPNEMGVRGGIEYGFSSTTVDREQAMMYAGGGGETDASTIFEMQMGMVDRGADLTWLSQYPHEREVLLPPLTGIEALGTDVEGSLMIIHSRLSLNLAAHTLEQVLSRRRKMLLDMTAGIELEMRDALGEELVKLGIRILNKALTYGPLAKDPEWFNDDENFAHCMQQTLYLQHGIVTEIKTLSKAEAELTLKGWKMRGPSRVLLLAGWVYHRTTLSGFDGALSIDLSDAELNTTEAVELAELLASNPRLTSVDVRHNETMGYDGAKALAAFMGGLGRGVTHVPRSLSGVTPAHSTLEIPKTLADVEKLVLCSELHSHVFSEGITAGMGKKNAVLNRRGASAANEWQPFLWAVKENRLDLVETLLDEFGCDINEQQPITTSSNQSSALHIAATKGLEEMCTLLLKRGAKKDLKDKHNNTPLKLAESKQNDNIITMLGGDPKALKRGPVAE